MVDIFSHGRMPILAVSRLHMIDPSSIEHKCLLYSLSKLHLTDNNNNNISQAGTPWHDNCVHLPVSWVCAGQTDGQSPDRYITLTARCGSRNNCITDYVGLITSGILTVYGCLKLLVAMQFNSIKVCQYSIFQLLIFLGSSFSDGAFSTDSWLTGCV